MRPLVGCAVVIFLAACSGAAPSGFGNSGGDDSNGGGSGDNGGDGGAGTSSGGEGGSSTVVPPAPTNLLAGADVTQINVYQGTESIIVQSSAATTPGVTLVAGRPALFRVFVTPESGFAGGNVTAQLRFEDAGGQALDSISASASISAASTENDTSSTINFSVPATDIVAGGKYSVALVDSGAPSVPAGTANPARFPQDGTTQAHGAKATGSLKITLVPVITSGGSPPDTSAAQLQILHDTMFALYPVTDVQITVHSTYNFNGTVSGTSSTGYENVLEAITQLRQDDSPPDDVYYWGTFDPKATFDQFCQGGCIAGLSTVDEEADDAADRVSTGIGYTGSDTAFTMAHEVGHAHGRNHAPGCGASGIDGSFPSAYIVNSSEVGQFGSIGILGYDLVGKTFQDPSQTGDMMGYCPPTWVSDYTYSALFTRVQQVNGAADVIGSPLKFTTPQPYRFVNLYDDGSMRWGQAINMHDKPSGLADHTITYLDANGNALGTASAHMHRFDHSNGGYLLVPEGPAGYVSIRVTNVGKAAVEKTLVKNY
jgi:hypothetical protein